MRRTIIAAIFLLAIFLFVSPSFDVEAATIGQAVVEYNNEQYLVDLTCSIDPYFLYNTGTQNTIYGYQDYNNKYGIYYPNLSGGLYEWGLTPWVLVVAYIPSLNLDYTYDVDYGSGVHRYNHIYNTYEEFYEDLPDQFKPSLLDNIWDDFYQLYYTIYGFYPHPNSLIGWLRDQTTDEEPIDIVYPTLTPSPSPTPTPTPIPVQTIFVPDGNGNTTIIYQYPDPTTGIITQSPYNPNITNNIEVKCNCGGNDGDDIFTTPAQDPYTMTSSMLWGDGFGVQITDNPLLAANDQQTTLKGAAEVHIESVNVLSNAFNILPVKWLTLVGLLGGILIIAGLIRTFLGG